MSTDVFNEYRIMWLFVFFDLPTNTKSQRQAASGFRKELLNDGFTMKQYSIYIRPCASKEITETHIKRVENLTPEEGKVSILKVTEKQVGNMINILHSKQEIYTKKNKQLTFF